MSRKCSVNEFLFFSAWILFASSLILMSAIFYVNNPELELMFKMVRYVSYAVCAVKIMNCDYSVRKMIYIICVVIVFAISGIGAKNLTYPLYCFIVLAAIDIDNEKIINATAWIQGSLLVIIISFSQMGIIMDYVFDPNKRARHGLGFSWTTTAPIIFFYFVLCLAYVHRRKMPVLLLIVLEVISVWLYRMTDSKMAFLVTTVFLLFSIFERFNKKPFKWLSHFKIIYIAFPLIMLLITLIVVHKYDWYNPTWAKIDRLMSYRLGLAQNAYNNYGIHLFGQSIQWVGYDYKSLLANSNETYNYVDSSYLQLAFNNGLIFLMAILGIYSYGIFKAIGSNDYYLVMIYLVILVFSLTEPRLLNFAYNPFPLLALGRMQDDLSGIPYFPKNNMKKRIRLSM